MRISDWSSDVCSSDLLLFQFSGRSAPNSCLTRNGTLPWQSISSKASIGMNSPSSHDHHHSTGEAPVETADGRVTDPVCGMQVDPATTPHHADHAGAHFHFCSERCRAKFVADPERYLTYRDEPEMAQPGAIYTCPMHPEVRQQGPGNCPFCGMALEPEMPSMADDYNPELRDFSRRFWWTRSEERRVGDECVSSCRYWWS